MVAPQRQTKPVLRPEKPVPSRAPRRSQWLEGRNQRRKFAILVLLPVLLMLGSVYLHTVAANLGVEATALQERHAGLLAEKEALEVEVSELSAPGRIRSIARENLGMRSPGAENMRAHDREDGEQDGNQEIHEGSRQ